MHKTEGKTIVQIENIEEMRHLLGIDDLELRQKIRGLKSGDSVNLTFLTGTEQAKGETLLVRITSIRGNAFRGKLVTKPASKSASAPQVGSSVVFTAAHIHSLP